MDRALDVATAAANGREFDFARLFTGGGEGILSPLSREGRVRQLCWCNEGKFTVETAKSILRDHVAGVCCHGDFETRGSQVSALRQGDHAHWFIERPFPCQERYELWGHPLAASGQLAKRIPDASHHLIPMVAT